MKTETGKMYRKKVTIFSKIPRTKKNWIIPWLIVLFTNMVPCCCSGWTSVALDTICCCWVLIGNGSLEETCGIIWLAGCCCNPRLLLGATLPGTAWPGMTCWERNVKKWQHRLIDTEIPDHITRFLILTVWRAMKARISFY